MNVMTDGVLYPVCEIFTSLQGEGYHTGKAVVFVRFSGCNLVCPFCDTDHLSGRRMMSADAIADEVVRSGRHHVVLTGGEPALWIDGALLSTLRRAVGDSCYVQVETNGTRSVGCCDQIDWITCSPKTHERAIERVDELKVVMSPGVDPDGWIAEFADASVRCVQPCSCQNTAEAVDYVENHPGWRLSLQTHKLISIK